MRRSNLLFIHLALLSLLIWWASPVVVDLAGIPGLPLDSLLWVVTFGVLGHFTTMIFGTGYLLIPAMLHARLHSPAMVVIHLALAAAALVGLAMAAWLQDPFLWGLALVPWGAGAFLFAANVILTVRDRRGTLRRVGVGLELPTDRFGVPLTVVAGIYLLGATVGFTLYGLGPTVGLGSWPLPPFLHLYLLGFVTNMIFGVGYHLFPRFLGAPPHRSLALVNVTLPIAAPAIFALAMRPGSLPFQLIALVEATAIVAFAANVISMFLRRSRRLPPAYFLLASAVALLIGPPLGVLFALAPETLTAVRIHMRVNLIGFVAFTIFGVSLYIFPFFPEGKLPASYTRALAALGLGLGGLALLVLANVLSVLGPGAPSGVGFGGEILLFASALAYTSSLFPSTMLIWRTRGPHVPVGSWEASAAGPPH